MDAEAQEEELASLEAIYGDDFTLQQAERIVEVSNLPPQPIALATAAAAANDLRRRRFRSDPPRPAAPALSRILAPVSPTRHHHLHPPTPPHSTPPHQVHIPSREADPRIVARAILPADYPSASPPVAEVAAPHLEPGAAAAAAAQLDALFAPGEVVLFAWFEWLREQHEAWQDAHADADALAAGVEDGLAAGSSGGDEESGSGGSDEDWEGEYEGHDEAVAAAAAEERRVSWGMWSLCDLVGHRRGSSIPLCLVDSLCVPLTRTPPHPPTQKPHAPAAAPPTRPAGSSSSSKQRPAPAGEGETAVKATSSWLSWLLWQTGSCPGSR
jgi:hypothetical protein